jgi:hypothetical protein
MLLDGGGSRLVPSKLEQSVKDEGKVAENHGLPNDGFFDEPQLPNWKCLWTCVDWTCLGLLYCRSIKDHWRG